MPSRKGNGRQRQLGRRLRRMREDAGPTLDVAAARLEFSTSKLSRIENAEQTVDIHVAKSMLDLYDVGGDRWTDTLQLVRDAREKPWYADYPPLGDYGYTGYEADADQVQDWAPAHVPVDPAMMRRQIAPLIATAALLSVTLQVMPAHTGPHASVSSGFSVLSFGDPFGGTTPWTSSDSRGAPAASAVATGMAASRSPLSPTVSPCVTRRTALAPRTSVPGRPGWRC